MTETAKPDMWAVVEIMGHKRIAGKVSEEVKFGVPMMRVDVPKTSTHDAFVRYFGGGSIHSFTPMDEVSVRRAAEWLDESPSVLPGVIESPSLAAKNTHLDDDDYYGDDLDDPDEDGYGYDDDGNRKSGWMNVATPDEDDEEPARDIPSSKYIVSMERGETSGSQSPMWRCITADGEKVNVFKHKDASRDTFHLFNDAGYGSMMELMKVGDVLKWEGCPIDVFMEKKGTWWEVTRVARMPTSAKPEIGRDDLKAKAEAAAWAKALIKSDDWVLLDCETTGLDKDVDEPVSIAILAPDGAVLLDTLVNADASIDKAASNVHGITLDTLLDKAAPLFEEVHPKLRQILDSKKIIVYNAEFDNAMLINAAKAAKIDPVDFIGNGWYCAMLKYAEFYGEWNPHHANYKNQSLEKACEQQGITVDAPAHTALGDCLRTLALIKKMAAYDPHPF